MALIDENRKLFRYEEIGEVTHMTEPFSTLYLSSFSIDDDIPQGEYYADLPIVRQIQKAGKFQFTKPVTFFVGENGIGKSSIIEALAVAAGFNPEGGTLFYSFHTNDSHSSLYRHVRVSRGVRRNTDGFFLRAESFYNAATYLDETAKDAPEGVDPYASYGGKSFHNQSHGESFLALALNRFSGRGLFILDEPEAALSPLGQLKLLRVLYEKVQEGAQFIISTHSPILISLPDADVVQLDENGLQHLPYQETEHFKVVSNFMMNSERMLRILLE